MLAAIQRLRQRQSRLGLPGAARAHEHEDTNGPVRIIEPRATGLHPLRDHLQSVPLSDDTTLQQIRQLKHLLDFVFDHPAHRNARPVRHDARNCVLIDIRKYQRRFPLKRRQFFLERFQFRQQRVSLLVRERIFGVNGHARLQLVRLALDRRTGGTQFAPQLKHLRHQRLLFVPMLLQISQNCLFPTQLLRHFVETKLMVDPDARFAVQNLQLGLEGLNAPPAVVDLSGH